ncbi:archaeosine synthase subunit alpha [uncultured Methanospirillum sp.]|uniref:archaeosine synthase subunit alpha n=1 Tax=uncultured Methanospirillum sp. TaxID=262503 RepID=UPI0029C8D431|nr:archaeosine synthase subunit alpha [uncultured Methanospirillum sp.]
MRTCEFTARDGTGRAGRLRIDETEYLLPWAGDISSLFPALAERRLDALFPSDNLEFVEKYFITDGKQPIPVHIHHPDELKSGDAVITPNWHTLNNQPRDFIRHLQILKERIPPDTCWYYPGGALPENVAILVHAGFDLFDFTGVDLKAVQGRFCLPDGDYPESVMEEGLCPCPGCQAGDLREHNRYALRQELALIRTRIRSGTFREFLEGRVRTRPSYVSIMRHLDRSPLMEQHTPVTRPTPFIASSGDSIHRPEVKRFAERLLTRYIPPLTDVAVLLPCSARKPYSLSQSHHKFTQAISRRAHELILTSPLGLVPRDIELVYPAAHYDVPVTGYWDHEERFQIADTLAKYLMKHQYRRVIAHLDGDALLIAKDAADQAGVSLESTCSSHPTDADALRQLSEALTGEKKVKNHLLRGMVSMQFGYDLRIPGLEVKGSYPELIVKKGRQQIFSLEPTTGMLRPTFDGWGMIETGYRVYIDDFVPQGDILAPGVVEADPAIREGDEILVVGENAMATGRAVMSADEMIRSHRGVAVRVRKVKKLNG